MARNNVYEVAYDETKVTNLDTNSEDYQKALAESKVVAHVVLAPTLREALEKAEAQKLTYFTVHDLKLVKTNVNVL